MLMQTLKTNSKLQKILLSLLTGILVNAFWIVVIFIIVISSTSYESLSNTLPARTPAAYTYFWLEMFLPGQLSDFAAFAVNFLLYSALSYGLLSLFGKNKINGKKILSLFIGIFMNPFLIFGLLTMESQISSGAALFPINISHQIPFGYMFCWSTMFLPENPIDLRAATFIPLIVNPILYFVLSYGLLNLLSRENKLK